MKCIARHGVWGKWEHKRGIPGWECQDTASSMRGNADTGLLAKRNILIPFDQNEKWKQLNTFWI